jgi:catechol 2,3-dioxygenase-like lactoylglutathione lyase family enzyme
MTALQPPVVRQVVLDCPDPRRLAEFYRHLLGYAYRPGDEAPPAGRPDPLGDDWLVLRPATDDVVDGRGLAFQKSAHHEPPLWDPTPGLHVAGGQQQMHLDLTVPDPESLARQRDRAVELGASVLLDRSADDEEPLYVFADPAGHPFCIFVG